ncbi:MAG: glycosyltransferase [Helicobacteraceae bacterium]
MKVTKTACIICVYKSDRLDFFTQAINSVINSAAGGGQPINIYLGIDGELPLDLSSYINANSNLFYKIIKNPTNMGLAYTLNRLIDALEDEEYIFRMDSDDVCKPHRIPKQVEFMEQNRNVEILGGAIEEIDEHGTPKMIRTYPKNTQEALGYIHKASIFAHPTVCFRKRFFERGKRYSTTCGKNEDLQLWFDALSSGVQVANLSDILLAYRVTESFYKRRNYRIAVDELRTYWRGILKLNGASLKLLYPLARFAARLMPLGITKILYSKHIRGFLNKSA